MTGVTDDRDDPGLKNIGSDGMQEKYLVLSAEERAKGFVRPVRRSYVHVGLAGPKYPIRDLTAAENELWGNRYAKYEPYPKPNPDGSSSIGRFWSQKDLDRVGKACQGVTQMGIALAETYARSPGFYGGTYCVHCHTHFPVGRDGEFVWDGTDIRVGT